MNIDPLALCGRIRTFSSVHVGATTYLHSRVVLTSSDRGIKSNHSRSLETGLESAYSWMNGLVVGNQTWSANTIQVGVNHATVSRFQNIVNKQIIYLRLPDGGPVGSGFATNKNESLRKLYAGDVETITTTDGKATTRSNISNGLSRMRPKPQVSACWTTKPASQMRGTTEKITQTMSCAGSFARRFNANLKKTGLDFKQNLAAFPTYAEHDQYMCMNNVEDDAKNTLF
ncbi:hypothetical protein E8E12_002076 [Didymella heteroderae]|uniref:Uncharacterized protein n=1 Tax=Didymella heteroderae TaxID=1769908 RepID=A0A9P4WKQ9_9PLEO|nr:hypothetical protein E8E12_002076 [Didymella heteroderae]